MSQHTNHHTDHNHADASPHGSLKSYLIGFGLSVVLTVIPFWLVMGHPLDGIFSTRMPLILLLMVFAVAQMLVHMVYFLHMHPKSEGGWTMLATVFTLILVTIAMSGSIWVMYHLNANMMPMHNMSTMDTTGEAWLPTATTTSPTTVISGTLPVKE